jgi:hypothetical protein
MSTPVLFETFVRSWLAGAAEWTPQCVRCRKALADGSLDGDLLCVRCVDLQLAGRGSATEGSGAEAPAA